jgi:2-iminobutanoate/2-iminopropanoate deaminase
MTTTPVNPSAVHAPAGAYSHAVSVRGPGRTLYISGQLGVDADGTLADGSAGQARQCLRNLVALLEGDQMTVYNLVKLTTFPTDIAGAEEFGAIRAPFLDGARPASTLIGTSGLVRPDWLIEVEAIAFAAEDGTV